MKAKKKKVEDGYRSVRIHTSVAELLAENKRKTGIMVGHFTEQAIIEKLKRDEKVRAQKA